MEHTGTNVRVYHTPTDAQMKQYEDYLKDNPSGIVALSATIHETLASLDDNDTAQEAYIFAIRSFLDQHCLNKNLDRGVLIAPDIERDLVAESRSSASNSARLNHVTFPSNDESRDYSPLVDTRRFTRKRSNAISLAALHQTRLGPRGSGIVKVSKSTSAAGRSAIDVSTQLPSMYSDKVLNQFHINQGTGQSPNHPVIIGVGGNRQMVKPDMALSGTVSASAMEDRKRHVAQSLRGQTFKKFHAGLQQFVTPHPWLTHSWMDVLFSCLGGRGWSNFQSVLQEYITGSRDDAQSPLLYTARAMAATEVNPGLRAFYDMLVEVLRHDLESNSYRSLLKSQAEIELFSRWRDIVRDMKSHGSALNHRIAAFQTITRDPSATSDVEFEVKQFLMSELSITSEKLESHLLCSGAKHSIAQQVGLGFFMLLQHPRFHRLLQMGGDLTTPMFTVFLKSNPELAQLSLRLSTYLQQLLANQMSLEDMGSDIKGSEHFVGKIDSLLGHYEGPG